MSNFTPGPWKVQLTYGSISNYNVIPKEKDLAEAVANRNLIEKAPEMYELLVEIMNEPSQLVDDEPIKELLKEIDK